MEDSKHIWVQLLDRTQKRLKVVIIALESFVSEGSNTHPPLPYVLWEESTEVWITVRIRYTYIRVSDCTVLYWVICTYN